MSLWTRPTQRRQITVVALAVALASFSWTWLVGNFGIFAFDQSIVFDGGWRILAGQVPFKDFLMAFGPVAFTLQALFFKILGVNWAAAVAAGAVIAVAAALSVMRTMALLFGKERLWLSGGCGLLVGLSYQSMFGTLFIEQVAFLFCLLGVQTICESLRSRGWRRWSCLGLAGMLAVLSFFSKQNAGVLTVALLAGLTLAGERHDRRETVRSLAAFFLGLALAAGLFAAWVVCFSDPQLFLHHFFDVPSQTGLRRVGLKTLLSSRFLLSAFPVSMIWCYAVALGSAAYWSLRLKAAPELRQRAVKTPAWRLAFFLTVAAPLVQGLFQLTTSNQAQNLLFWSALNLYLGIGLTGFWRDPAVDPPRRWWMAPLVFAATACLLCEIGYYGWTRKVHDVFPEARVSRKLRVPQLASVRWMSPTKPSATSAEEIRPEDLEALCEYLASHKQDFLVLGDSSFLYGINGVVPPQPLLYVQRNHYYTDSDAVELDGWILSDLQERDIRMIVRERISFFGEFPFPDTVGWINRSFRPGPAFGNYQILLR